MDYRYFLNENIESKIQEYIKELQTEYNWNQVELGFGDANDERFATLHVDYECTHPKKLYRPGKTLICHFLSIKNELVDSHENDEISDGDWERICLETRQVSRGITDAILSTFQDFGREISLLSELDGWSHVHGAEIAGLGKFEKKGYMVHRGAEIGCLGSVVTEIEL